MSIQNIYNIGSLINLVIILAMLIGGLWVLRRSVVKATNEIQKNASEVQESAINAMREEIATLRQRLDDARTEIKRLNSILKTIANAAKARGLIIEFDDDLIHVTDNSGTKKTISRIEEGNE